MKHLPSIGRLHVKMFKPWTECVGATCSIADQSLKGEINPDHVGRRVSASHTSADNLRKDSASKVVQCVLQQADVMISSFTRVVAFSPTWQLILTRKHDGAHPIHPTASVGSISDVPLYFQISAKRFFQSMDPVSPGLWMDVWMLQLLREVTRAWRTRSDVNMHPAAIHVTSFSSAGRRRAQDSRTCLIRCRLVGLRSGDLYSRFLPGAGKAVYFTRCVSVSPCEGTS